MFQNLPRLAIVVKIAVAFPVWVTGPWLTKTCLLIKTTFNWAWLTDSEVQSIVIKVRAWQHLGRHGTGRAESSTSQSKGCEWNTDFQAPRVRVLS